MFLIRQEADQPARTFELTDKGEKQPHPHQEMAWSFLPHLGAEGQHGPSALCGPGRAAIGKTAERARELLESVTLDDETVVEALAA
jgi:hypothetical protein